MNRILWEEFAPFDVGFNLFTSDALKNVSALLQRLGWTDEQDDAGREVTPHRAGLWSKGSSQIYIPKSGFAVLRFRPVDEITGTNQFLVTARALGLRQKLHQNLEASIPRDAADAVHKLRSLPSRSKVESAYRSHRRESPFTYSLTYFHVDDALDLPSRSCLLALSSPRLVGCSSSDPAPAGATDENGGLPDDQVTTIARRIEHIDEDFGDVSTLDAHGGNGLIVRASWSTVVSTGSRTDDDLAVISACEYRVQSTWLAANHIGQSAWRSQGDLEAPSSRRKVSWAASEFNLIVTQNDQRIGANSPHFPTKLLENLKSTSGLNDEIANAKALVDSAHERSSLYEDERSRHRQKALEALILVFTSASLTQLLFDLPFQFTWDYFLSYRWQFFGWFSAMAVGLWIIFIRER